MSHAAHARAPRPFELEFDLRPACLRIQSGARDDELLDFIARCCCRLGADRGGSAGVALTATATMARVGTRLLMNYRRGVCQPGAVGMCASATEPERFPLARCPSAPSFARFPLTSRRGGISH